MPAHGFVSPSALKQAAFSGCLFDSHYFQAAFAKHSGSLKKTPLKFSGCL
jgi:hypothetical protein